LSVGVTFGKLNSGTVVSEGQDVLLHFLANALLELYDTTSHCFVQAPALFQHCGF
jgi:hypothetical protein